MDVSPLLDGLNPAQREAVAAPSQPVLVLAGAGSGKTRVLVHRIAWLIGVENIAPHGLLAVTFTNKAASEMRGRIEELLDYPASGLWVGTFHGLAHRLLRQHWQEAALPQSFQILDSDDQLRMVKRVLRGLELEESHWPPKQAQGYINARKDEGSRPEHLPDTGDPIARQWVRIYTAYQQACERAGVVDFAELLLRSLELLRDNPGLLEHYRTRFRHVLVDEFQDTNDIQYAWLRLIAGGSPVFAVGDDDQSIYGWRGAKIENIQHFQKDYPGTQVVRLEQNYRSTASILNAANALIRHNSGRLGKELWTEDLEGAPVRLYTALNEQEEARFIAETIARHIEDGGQHRECAVLYRSNAQSRVLEETFIARRLPYRVYGGLRFFERQEIRDALAYLRLAGNSDDDPAFLRAVNQPPRGIGEKTLDDLRAVAAEQDISLLRAAQRAVQANALPGRARNAVAGFLQLIEQIREALTGQPLAEQVEQAIALSGLREHYAKEKGERGEARLENLDELVGAARAFDMEEIREEETTGDRLTDFLSHAALESGEGSADPDDDAIQMMTLHSAKGLEFPLVFLTGLEDGLFPNARSVDEPGRLEEERRLAYVGMTRAERQLYLTHAETRRLYGREASNPASRFLNEIPEDMLEVLRPQSSPYASGRFAAARRRTAGMDAQAESAREEGLAIGTRVHHARFGEGLVTAFEGSGSSARVQVNFADAGAKWLVVGFAKLDVLA
ncbi:DNA helicase II [Thioalkalivibrio sp. ALJ24]|uniref:DNA helicase II n=1 Tax=Thioalkalivibrio sp. ALJ24 TaxID=545276 RepID=UPI00037D3772|nr:DNA helicase II [Thioalkalivibrio sp. ALJ24]